MKQLSQVKELHRFNLRDFIAGSTPIDFVNTVTGRNARPRDWLTDPKALLDWAVISGTITEPEAEQLAKLYQDSPNLAEAALRKATNLRQALFELLDAVTIGDVPTNQSLIIIKENWLAAASTANVSWCRFNGLEIIKDVANADLIADRLVMEFVALGAKLISPRLRRCAGKDCGWFFIDTSKAGRRRWCDMDTCGNVAKYARSRN